MLGQSADSCKNTIKYIMIEINYYISILCRKYSKDFKRFKNRMQTCDVLLKSNAKFGEKKTVLNIVKSASLMRSTINKICHPKYCLRNISWAEISQNIYILVLC